MGGSFSSGEVLVALRYLPGESGKAIAGAIEVPERNGGQDTFGLESGEEEGTLDRLEMAEELAQRLMELGFLPGVRVSAGRAAPGGDPMVFRVDGSEIAIRRATARLLILSDSGQAGEEGDNV